MDDLISRKAAIDAFYKHPNIDWTTLDVLAKINALPSAQPETHEERTETHTCDLISRQAAIDAIENTEWYHLRGGVMVHGANSKEHQAWYKEQDIYKALEQLPSAQSEHTCVNCGRTVNNGGWYADGGTRCPIEEHYALPKDGYCHLWEKRNITDDDYPERRTDVDANT